jgi:two-component system response regulator HydG
VTYDWPGNVRELERVMEAALTMVRGSQVELDDLPANVRGHYVDALLPSVVQGESLRAWGSRYVRLVLERCGHNKREACRVLDISYHTLQAYLRQGLGAALSHEPWTPQLEAALVREGAEAAAAASEPEP